MLLRIETLPPKKFIGKRTMMSYGNNKTFELWQSFMPHRQEVKNRIGDEFYSIQIFDQPFNFTAFKPDTVSEKWAAVEVSDTTQLPVDMEILYLPGGQYAVFLHKGMPETFYHTLQFIFENWLPRSEYILDHRPYFEVLGEKYRRDDPASEEEVWIPVRNKQ